ncbi:PEP/pyruvate-binding domain-containing protein [Streptomyces sp. NPDC002994]|uniref:PEP/pyruvate-binding domain-containing protein n=1 Tax=Streptomyces sp. NPDC002994 TaxID=3154441 RepID=UPI0033BEF93C
MSSGLERLAVIPLEAEEARNPAVTGAKAANLARAAAAGLPVLPGFTLMPAPPSATAAHGEAALRAAWRELTGEEGRPLVVRSSSAVEDTSDSSMAGLFASVLDVRGWESFTSAVRTVLGSARRSEHDGMAVLVRDVRGGPVAGGVRPLRRRRQAHRLHSRRLCGEHR